RSISQCAGHCGEDRDTEPPRHRLRALRVVRVRMRQEYRYDDAVANLTGDGVQMLAGARPGIDHSHPLPAYQVGPGPVRRERRWIRSEDGPNHRWARYSRSAIRTSASLSATMPITSSSASVKAASVW